MIPAAVVAVVESSMEPYVVIAMFDLIIIYDSVCSIHRMKLSCVSLFVPVERRTDKMVRKKQILGVLEYR